MQDTFTYYEIYEEEKCDNQGKKNINRSNR